MDGAGNFFIADRFGRRIRKVDGAGILTTVAGTGARGFSGDGGPATDAALNSTNGVAVDGAGNLFIADSGNNRIRKVDGAGIITTVAGGGGRGFSGDGGPATAAALRFPLGVAVDGAGNLFIADSSNNRIRKVDGAGIITTVAGTGAFGFSGDGGPRMQLWASQRAWRWMEPAISSSPMHLVGGYARWMGRGPSPQWPGRVRSGFQATEDRPRLQRWLPQLEWRWMEPAISSSPMKTIDGFGP